MLAAGQVNSHDRIVVIYARRRHGLRCYACSREQTREDHRN
jgi:hypothetical protein